jgi:hypothetical protein
VSGKLELPHQCVSHMLVIIDDQNSSRKRHNHIYETGKILRCCVTGTLYRRFQAGATLTSDTASDPEQQPVAILQYN